MLLQNSKILASAEDSRILIDNSSLLESLETESIDIEER